MKVEKPRHWGDFRIGNFYQNDRGFQGRDGNSFGGRNQFPDPRNNNRGTFGQFNNQNRRPMNNGPPNNGNGGNGGNTNRVGVGLPSFFANKNQRQQERSRRPPPVNDFPESSSSSCK